MNSKIFRVKTTGIYYRICVHFNVKVISAGYEIRGFSTPFLKRFAISIWSIEDVNEIAVTIGAGFEIYRQYNQSYLVIALSLDAPETMHISPVLFGKISTAHCLSKLACTEVQVVFAHYMGLVGKRKLLK